MIQNNWQELIKPSSIKVIKNNENNNNLILKAEPLERGYGTTLGNTLRRILLSSLQGAAIIGFKIDGVSHEYDSISEIKEDVMQIIANIKKIRFIKHTNEDKVIKISKSGPGLVTAKDIEVDSSVEVVNSDALICSLNDKADFNMEIIVSMGKGYVPSEINFNKVSHYGSGYIAIDSVFSPVKKFSFDVENSRVGQITDYDSLVMNIVTDGSIDPKTAIGLASRILQDQVALFIDFEDPVENIAPVKEETLPFDKVFLRRVEDLDLSVRSANCLKNENIDYIGDLVVRTEESMLRTANFGRKSLDEIKALLVTMNLRLGLVIDGWRPDNLEDLVKKYIDQF